MIAKLKAIPYLPLLTALMLLRLVAAAFGPLSPDESYYWLWAQHPALGYYDHPPMVAWWIMVSTSVFGHSALAVRLPFVLSFVGLSWLMWDSARFLFSDAIAKRALLWHNACLLLSIGSVIATPDPPSVLMWAGGLWALCRLIATGKGWWWLVFGLFAGLGVEAKYTNLFLGLGVLVWFAMDKPARRCLATPWPWLGAIVAAVLMLPNILWNAGHGWITVVKQFGRIGADHLTVQYLVELILTQPLLLNVLIFVFVVIGMLAAFQNTDSRLRLLAALPLPLVAYLLVHVFHDRIQGNWPAPIYPGLVLLGAVMAEGMTEGKIMRAKNLAAPFGIAVSAIALVVLGLAGVVPLPGVAGLGYGWDRLSSDIAVRQVQTGATWIATTDYDSEGELSYYLPGHPVVGMAERSRYAWPSPVSGQKALIVVSLNHTPDLDRCFDGLTDLGVVSRLSKAGKKSDYRLWFGSLKDPGCDVEPRGG